MEAISAVQFPKGSSHFFLSVSNGLRHNSTTDRMELFLNSHPPVGEGGYPGREENRRNRVS